MNAVELSGVGKKYIIRHERPVFVKDLFLKAFFRRAKKEEFWALKDFGFEAAKGEIVGIIGENGAGKSTLLKILTGVTRADEGSVKIEGRVGALLELGAGFHPELTGRENIYLNGSILGLRRKEIERKLDHIVEFSGIRDFIDTPVRTYSSGMFVRLGFSIAVHMDPDILLIDEVLAVGDILFQQKCLDRIKAYHQEGKTILFVSHDLGTVRTICEKVLWVAGGRLRRLGKPADVVDEYIVSQMEQKGPAAAAEAVSRKRSVMTIAGVRILDSGGNPKNAFSTGEDMIVEVSYEAGESVSSPTFGIAVHRGDGLYICGLNTKLDHVLRETFLGKGAVRLTYPKIPLLTGTYALSVAIFDEQALARYDFHDRRYTFSVSSPYLAEGVFLLNHKWTK